MIEVSGMIKKLIFISVLLLICIVMMEVSLLVDAKTFGELSSYFAIVCVVLSVVGVSIAIRKEYK